MSGGGAGNSNPLNMLWGKGGAKPTPITVNKTVKVREDWRGKVGMAGYLVALVFAFALYPPSGLGQKALCWAGVGVGLLVVVLAIWLRFASDKGSDNLIGLNSIDATVGIGASLNVVAGVVVAAAGFLKTHEEKLI